MGIVPLLRPDQFDQGSILVGLGAGRILLVVRTWTEEETRPLGTVWRNCRDIPRFGPGTKR